MQQRAFVVRGLAKEVEEDLNKYLSTHDVQVLHVGQSETGDHISVTLLVAFQDPLTEGD